MPAEVSTIETIYTADLSSLEQGATKAQGVFDETAKSAERSSERVSSSFKRTAQATSKAVDDAFKEADARLSKKFREVERSVESLEKQASSIRPKAAIKSDLLSELPAGSSINRVRNISDELKKLSQIAGETEGGVSKVSAVIGALGGTSVVVGAGLVVLGAGIGAVTAALAKAAFDAAEFDGKLYDLSKRTGFTTETLSALRLAADQSGSSIEAIAASLKIFDKNVYGAAGSNEKLAATFKTLNIDVSSNEKALAGAFRVLSTLPDGATKTAIALKLFGRAGDSVLGVIDQMNGDLPKFVQTVKDMGLSVSEDGAKAADEFGDAWVEAKNRLHGISIEIGRQAMPAIQQGLDDVNDSLKTSKGEWSSWAGFVKNSVKGLSIGIVAELEGIAEAARHGPLFGLLTAVAGMDRAFAKQRGPTVASGGDLPSGITDLLGKQYAGQEDKDKGKSGESAARRAARQALELAQIDLRDAEGIYNHKLSIERRSYEQSLENLEKYTANSIQLENDRYEAERKVFDKERQAASQLPTAGERDVKQADIRQRASEAERKHQETVNQIKADGYSKGQDIQRRAADDTIRVQEEVNRTLEAALRAQVETGVRTFAEVEDILFQGTQNVQRLTAERLRKDLEASLGGDIAGLAGTLKPKIDELMKAVLSGDNVSTAGLGESIVGAAFDPAAAQAALRQIQTFLEQVKQANLKHNDDSANARADDKQNAISYVEQLRSIYRGVIELNQEIEQSRIDSFSTNNYRRGESIEAQRSLDRSRELVRSGEAIRELAHRREIAQLSKDEGEKAKILAALKGAEEAEYRASNARLDAIDREAAEKRREYLVEVADDLAGIFNDIRSGLGDGWDNFWDNLLNTVKRTVDSILDELTRVTFESLITGENRGSNAGGLVGSVVNAITRPIFGSTPAPTPGTLTTNTANANFGPVPNRPLIQGSRASGGPVNEGLWQLHNREYVIDADSTAALGGDFLARLNRANSRADASMMLAGLGNSFNRQPAQAPAQGDINVIMALGEREIGKATETYGRTASGRRAAVMRARYDSKSVRRF